MLRVLVCGFWVLLGVNAFTALSAFAGDDVSTGAINVRQDDLGHGWDVRVSFKNAPTAFGRAAHVWTLDRAKEIADELLREHADVPQDLAVAEIRVEGKNGDGEIKPNQGPHLPDWPIVEQQFRVRTSLKSAELDKKLEEVKEAYEKAAEETEEVLRERKPISPEKEKALKALAQRYNSKADELDNAFFGGRPQPLPRLKIPEPKYVYEHAQDWVNTRRMQYQAERLGQETRRKEKSGIEASTESTGPKKTNAKQVEFDDTQPKGKLDEKNGTDEAKEDEVDRLRRLVNRQLRAVDNLMVDSSRIAPPADAFSAERGGAVYKSAPRVEVRKTDASGNALPDSKQPLGYPIPFRGGKVGSGEGLFVDPALRVELISKSPKSPPAEIRAGVYGRVTKVDPVANKVAVEVDSKGTSIVMTGIEPQGIEVGVFVEPSQPIGRPKASPQGPGRWSFVIRAINANNRLVSPGPVLDYARRPPTKPGQLERDVPENDAPELPAKESDAESGNGEGGETVIFDDEAEKGANLKLNALAPREFLAKRELDKAKEQESIKVDEAGILAAKVRQVETEIKAAEEKLKAFEVEGAKVLEEAETLAERRKGLEERLATLKDDKKNLDAQGARAKASNSEEEINAFNAEAKKHNARHTKLQDDDAALKREETTLAQKVAGMQREQTKEQKKETELKQELGGLKAKETSAKSELEQARGEVKAKEAAIAALEKEKEQLMQEAAEAKKKASSKGDSSAAKGSSATPKVGK